MSLRDSEFKESLQAFNSVSTLEQQPAKEVRAQTFLWCIQDSYLLPVLAEAARGHHVVSTDTSPHLSCSF